MDTLACWVDKELAEVPVDVAHTVSIVQFRVESKELEDLISMGPVDIHLVE